MKEFTRDPDSPVPLHRQVYQCLRAAILGGRMPAGARLPSTRSLARAWGVSRNTVLAAYEELTAEGLVASRVGSGTRVRGRGIRLQLPDPRVVAREAQYPVQPVPLVDPDGNPLYMHE